MSLLSHAARPRAAFSTIHALIIHQTPSYARHLSASCSYRWFQPCSSHTVRHNIIPFASIAIPSRPLRFDKVPDRLPDWWNDDDDDDDDDDHRKDEHNGGEDIDAGDDSIGGGRGRGGEGGGGGAGGGGGDWDDGTREGLFAAILAMYTRAIHKAPVRTKAISTCLLALLGDILAQRVACGEETFLWDRRRSASVGIWGLCFMGPLLHSWYGILDRLFFGRFAVWQKVICDQLLFAPVFNGAFIAAISSMEGSSPEEVAALLKSKLWPSMKANWTLWPAAQFVNFTFIPKTFQIVYVNCVALFWNAILTYISHDHNEKVELQGS